MGGTAPAAEEADDEAPKPSVGPASLARRGFADGPLDKAVAAARDAFEAGRVVEAVDALQRARFATHADAKAATAIAETLRARGNAEPARDILSAVLRRGRSDDALCALGATLTDLGALDGAEENLRFLLQTSPGHHRARLELARVQRLARRFERARDLATEALEGAGDDADLKRAALWELGRVYGGFGDARRQIDYLDQAAAVAGGPTLLAELAELHLAAGDADKAAATLARCGGEACASVAHFALRVRAELARDAPEAARGIVETALDHHGDDAELHLLVGRIAAAQGRETEALAACHKARELAPTKAGAYVEAARILGRQRRHAEARALLEGGLEVVADATPLLDTLAHLCREQQDRRCQRQIIERRLAGVDEPTPMQRLELARAALATGDAGLAVKQFEAVRDLVGLEGSDRFRYLEALYLSGRSDTALALLDQVLGDAARGPDGAVARARLHSLAHRPLQAAQVLTRASTRWPDSVAVQRELVLAYDAMGNPVSALGHLRSAAVLAPDDRALRLELVERLLSSADSDALREADAHMTELRAATLEPEARRQLAVLELVRQTRKARRARAVRARWASLAKADPASRDAIVRWAERLRELNPRGADFDAVVAAVLAAEPEHGLAHQALALVALTRGDKAEAETHLWPAAKAGGLRVAPALRALGDLLWERGDRPGAVEQYSRYLQAHPRPPADADAIVERVKGR